MFAKFNEISDKNQQLKIFDQVAVCIANQRLTTQRPSHM